MELLSRTMAAAVTASDLVSFEEESMSTKPYLINASGIITTTFTPLTNTTTPNELITTALPIVIFAEDFTFYALSIIIPVGCVCNILALLTFCRKRMRTQSSCWYLAALAVADTLVLLTELFSAWLPNYRIYVNWYNEVQAVCIITSYLSMTARSMSAWTIVMFTIERMVCVINPLKGIEQLANTTTAKRIIAVSVLICLIPASFVFALSTVRLKGVRMECTYSEAHSLLAQIFSMLWIIFCTFLPVILICVFNTVTVCKLSKLKHERSDLFSVKNHYYAIRKNRIAAMLLTVSTCFVILATPYLISWILVNRRNLSKDAIEYTIVKALLDIFRVFYIFNFAINLLLYSISGSKFRRELIRLVTCSDQGSATDSSFRKRSTQLSISRDVALQAQRRRSTLREVACMETINEESETKSELQVSDEPSGSRL